MFIGILSAGNHFAERMAVRKSWMQHKLIKSSNVVARFFVALVGQKLKLYLSSFSYIIFVMAVKFIYNRLLTEWKKGSKL